MGYGKLERVLGAGKLERVLGSKCWVLANAGGQNPAPSTQNPLEWVGHNPTPITHNLGGAATHNP